MLPVPLLFEPLNTIGRAPCNLCDTVHPCKVLHLDLDDTGAIIVSVEVKEKIWRVPTNGGFRVVNTVANPPAQGIYPETVKAKLRGIELGGGLQVAEPNRRYATVTKDVPPTKTVDLDEYVAIAERLGISMNTALNVLVANLLGLNQGRKTEERTDERRSITS